MSESILKSKKKHTPPPPGPGRPKGLKNKKTIIRETLILDGSQYFDKKFKENFRAIWDKVFEKARVGVPWAVGMVVERGMGKVKEVLEITEPALTNEEAMAIIRQHEKAKLNESTGS